MTDERYLVLSALGPDRPGLVAEVTAYLTECGANIEDSRMAVLGAEFGILVLVSGPEAALARVLSGVAGLEAKTKLAVVTRPTKSPEEHRRATVSPCVIRAEAIDREGIVRAIAGAIHDIGVNIVSLETETYPAPVTGSPLFRLAARVDVPAGLTLARVRAALDAVAQRENVDVDVRSGAGLARREPVRLGGPGRGGHHEGARRRPRGQEHAAGRTIGGALLAGSRGAIWWSDPCHSAAMSEWQPSQVAFCAAASRAWRRGAGPGSRGPSAARPSRPQAAAMPRLIVSRARVDGSAGGMTARRRHLPRRFTAVVVSEGGGRPGPGAEFAAIRAGGGGARPRPRAPSRHRILPSAPAAEASSL